MDNVSLFSHGPGNMGMRISNANVKASQTQFNSNNQNGIMVQIDGESNGTSFDGCAFLDGAAGEYYISIDGSSILFNNCRIETSTGARSVLAIDDPTGIASQVELINPVSDSAPGSWGDSFDNSSMNATGSSSITLKWYMDVYVIDPDSNPIDTVPVWVKDRLGNPAIPDSGITDGSGMAKGFTITELIKYENSITNFNAFNVSASNNSVMGYTEPLMNHSMIVTVMVPFSTVPNIPTIVSWLPTPSGLQSGVIIFDFILEDPDFADQGNLSIIADYSTDGTSWHPATSASGSDLNDLNNNTLYYFIWDSSKNLGHAYYPTVYLRITPRDKWGNGTFRQTGIFAVENKAPIVSWLPDPVGIQAGFITFDYMLEDPDSGDSGNLSISVEYSTDGISWHIATSGIQSDLTGLKNNTLYHFEWNSRQDIPYTYSTTVYIRITPRDRTANGTTRQTGNFTVDNLPPAFLDDPVVLATNTTAIINWTVDEPAEAMVWWGYYPICEIFTTGSTGSPFQSVQLTGLQPGRLYFYLVFSTDPYGNVDYWSNNTLFETEVHIPLFKGWNMISIPPYLLDSSPEDVLSSISGEYDAVRAYYASDPVDPWKEFRPDKSFGNDLTVITAMDGLWIHMKNDAVLIPDHKDPTPDPLFNGTSMGLEAGWNLVGYPSVRTRSVDDALVNVTYDMVQTYDAASGKWLTYDGISGDLTHMEMGRGYWIHCPVFNEWQVAYV
jgi:hypothetical protein